jgi:hypothetical protein
MKDVIDLTPETNKTGNLPGNWLVTDELRFSDQRHIYFQIGNTVITHVTFGDPMRTNRESYKDNL